VAAELRVETAELRTMGELLVECAATVSGLDSAALTARRGRYGHPALAGAAASFADRWGRGVQAIADDVRHSGTNLVSTAGWLETIDADAAAAARDLSVPQ
jgi:hypothetical protein